MTGYEKIFSCWDIGETSHRPDLTPTGSPNRSVERAVLQCANGRLLIAEGFDLTKKNKQIFQNGVLEFFHRSGCPGVFPWLRTIDGEHGKSYGTVFWQLREFIPSAPLDRTTLGDDRRIALVWADFLLQMKKISLLPGMPPAPNTNFCFADYMQQLSIFAAAKAPETVPHLRQISFRLQNFFDIEKSLPQMFAHGDFHPGNTLMKESGTLAAVIDWEFAGWKCAGYDLALLLGCLGMDDPRWLSGDAAAAMLDHLYLHDYMAQTAWDHLPLLIAAVRLGWLGEWIDLNDRALASQEIRFINMLLDDAIIQ